MSTVKIHHTNASTDKITLTDPAKEHILNYLRKNKENKGVRFSVKKTGCSGLSYVVDYVIKPQEKDLTQLLADGYYLYIDPTSYPYLQNMTVDYLKQGLNFKLVFNNPNQTGQCGCGESFTVN